MNQNHSHRLSVLTGFLLAILLIYVGVLYNNQITKHDYYMEKSVRSIARVETAPASRGLITDRSGRPLVTNRSTYALTFDTSLLRPHDDKNAAILRLVKLCQQQNVPYVDTLPISKTPPYRFQMEEALPSQKKAFLAFLKVLPDSKRALRDYLILHPEAAGVPPDEEDLPTKKPRSKKKAEEAALKIGSKLLEEMEPDALTNELLKNAGITPEKLTAWMVKKFDIPEEQFSTADLRLILGVRYELYLRRIKDAVSTSYVMAEEVDTPFINLLSDGNYSGARVIHSYVREYETTYAAHILGTVGRLTADDLKDPESIYRTNHYPMDAMVGRSGVEASFEEYLQGRNGTRVVSTNTDGKVTGEYYSKPPQPGNTVELTLDLRLQKAVEDSLGQTISTMNRNNPNLGAAGAAAVVKVGTGEVLALASCPTYNLSTYRQDFNTLSDKKLRPDLPLLNRALQGCYPPGSTLKPLTAVAALEEGKIGPTERLHTKGKWIYPGTNDGPSCWLTRAGGGTHGDINVSQAITVSCNYFFAEMGYRLGMDKLNEYLRAFGLGEHTGIELYEEVGLLPENPPGEDLSPQAAFGQANQLYTPLQLANYIATLVSGGRHNEAHLLKAVKTYNNTGVVALGNDEPKNMVNIAPSTLEAVKKGMHGLTQGSLASHFRNCIVPAGAKTGTAQLGKGKKNNGVFVCFAPYDDPEIAVAIAIEKGGAGSALADTAVNILNTYFSASQSAESGALGENTLRP